MYIKEICLEGFKSYATRTTVSGFDPRFNAITGYNGSGKSNILDSICFVMGITNLQQVRVANLQELVYKQGQAGVTKATVSIVFSNNDRSRSPIGYEDCPEITISRQIVVGGRNKYQINGHLAQPSKIQNLFHSVQLNVNNPHFLIMQGRITKVLNMKPMETLSMLEEAAGTRMYEMKKEAALKTLEKKQTKVDEIDSVLSQDIVPAFEKLRKERAQYMQWTEGNAKVDRLQRFCIAYKYSCAEQVKDAACNEIVDRRSKITELHDNIVQLENAIKEKEVEIVKLTAEKEMEMNSDFKLLAQHADKLSKELVKVDSSLMNQKDNLEAEKAAAKKIQTSASELEKTVAQKDAAVRQFEEEASAFTHKVEVLTKSLADKEKEYQGVQAGKNGSGDEKSLADQLADANAALGKLGTEATQIRMRITHLEKELKDKKAQLLSKQKEATTAENELQSRRAEVEKISAALGSIKFDEKHMDSLEKMRTEEMETVRKLKLEANMLAGQVNGVQFNYNDPTKDFDRSKVKGVVARLLQVKDSSTMTALEVAAAGKLFNVIVDTEQTGKLLLEKGGLQRRITIIPLNKIQASGIPPRVQAAATKLVGLDNARTALSLVCYEEDLEAAMAFVFGGTFVCTNMDIAKQVAFHKDIMTRSVTIDGDIFEPRGLLTGGSRKGGGELLLRLHSLAETEANLAVHTRKLSEIESEIATLAPLQKKFTHLKSQLELKTYDLSLFEGRAEQSEHHKLAEAVAALTSELQNENKELVKKDEEHQECLKTVEALKNSLKNHSQDRENCLQALEKEIKSLKKNLTSVSKDFKAQETARERLIMEKDAAIQEMQALGIELSTSQQQITKLEEAIGEVEAKRDAVKQEYLNANEELNSKRERMKECNVQISALVAAQGDLSQKLADLSLQAKRLDNEVKHLEKDQKDCAETVAKLREKHGWIASEKQLFGKPGTDYDFAAHDAQAAQQELEVLLVEQKNNEKRVNKKADALFGKADEESKELLKKREIVQNDKVKIQKVIHELDEKKKEALKATWQKVNKDFGSIFSMLLPGTMAKLEPPEGGDFMDGLEVRVAFGGVWKQSLSELSGGQRSLLALSLILALLLFKPAPLYILDEVDAALDLSHTQNIGRMIKAHFPQSQFIVVSLKEGMFNNANVIFRTKFVDGVSTVTRTVPSGSQAPSKKQKAANEQISQDFESQVSL
ncbi:unnamed protein product [Sphagnum troendelagicum]|uniref:Structural maintenance of chromosomes protein n=1 Tax=Sphagnum troendelagicum TaxID=128251 RepID=A0ABP0URS1_9BRYO